MVVESILLSILGNGAYDTVKKLVSDVFGIEDNKLVMKIYKCIDDAMNQFFEKYNQQFGSPEESFLARQENISLILKSMYYGSDINLKDELNKSGYQENTDASDDAINFFVNTLLDIMNEDMEFNKIITEKKHLIETAENQSHIMNMLKVLLEKGNKNVSNDNKWIIRDDEGNQLPYLEGEPIRTKFGKTGSIEVRIKNNIFYIEVLDDNGHQSYYEVDTNGNIKDLKMPFELSEYSLIFNKGEILHDNITKLNNGYYRRIIKFKWDRLADVIFDSNNRLQQIHLEGGWTVSHKEKIIKPID